MLWREALPQREQQLLGPTSTAIGFVSIGAEVSCGGNPARGRRQEF